MLRIPATVAHQPQLPASLIDVGEQRPADLPGPQAADFEVGSSLPGSRRWPGPRRRCDELRGPVAEQDRKSAAPSPRSIAVQEEEAERADPPAHVIRDMADIESIHAFEGTDTIQTLIVGLDITGTGAFS